jgi:hypothetical protein
VVEAHQADMMVATWQRTSVNHLVGQRRAVSGNNAWYGRTLQEAVALTYGAGFQAATIGCRAGMAQALGVSGRCHAAGHARDASERLRSPAQVDPHLRALAR